MAHALDLSGVHAKLKRTDEQVVFLNREMQAVLGEDEPYAIEFEENPHAGVYVARFRVLRPIEPRFSVIFGEIVHNLRSALDHLVCRIVEAYGGTARRTHYFSVYDDEVAFIRDVLCREKKRGAGPLKGIPPASDAWALIEGAQPYKRGEGAKDDPLYVVHSLWNRDKHRVLNAAFTFPDVGNLIDALVWDEAEPLLLKIDLALESDRPLKDRTKIATFWFDPRRAQPKMYVKGPLPLDIAFGDSESGRVSIGTIHATIFNLAEACKRAMAEADHAGSP